MLNEWRRRDNCSVSFAALDESECTVGDGGGGIVLCSACAIGRYLDDGAVGENSL